MKGKIFKISIAMMLLISLTMANFLFVGASFVSYAIDSISTNHQNVEFEAYFKDNEGKKVTTLQSAYENEAFLYLQVNVKKEGYFNGNISLENANFRLKEADSSYINKIEDHTIIFNQMNAGTAAEIKIKIEPIQKENFEVGSLSAASKVIVKGTYHDSTQKDITIGANREVRLETTQNNTPETMVNDLQVITNKVVKIAGQEKRVVQYSWKLGVKETNYPIKEIKANVTVPTINGQVPEISQLVRLNTMTSYDFNQEGANVTFDLKNEEKEGKALWETQGNETVLLTCIYNKESNLENAPVVAEQKITFYDAKEISSKVDKTISQEEVDGIIEISANTQEDSIYKGKLYAGIERQIESTTTVKVNLAKVVETLNVEEQASTYIVGEKEVETNHTFVRTVISKAQFDQLLGQNGVLTIYDQTGEELAKITNMTAVDNNGNIVVSYEGREVKSITIKITAPISEGSIDIKQIKKIQGADQNTIKNATQMKTKIIADYNKNGKTEVASEGITKETQTYLDLKDTQTKATLEINKDSLSTVITNNVEIKAVLISNEEQYDLYKNPVIEITLPEQVETISINHMDLLYEQELKIKEYHVEGRTIKIILEGAQTGYKEPAVEGATILMNADLTVNRKTASKEEAVTMAYQNANAVQYYENGVVSKAINIVAPKDMTTINSIKELNIETIGQEETKQVMLQRGNEAKQVEAQFEIINNHPEAVENVKILGDFPTNNQANNLNIQLASPISLKGVGQATIYYSENEQATDDLSNEENGWSTSLEQGKNYKRYLVLMDRMEAQSSIQGSYMIQIPAGLEYNQGAKEAYKVAYTNSQTKVANELNSTAISLQTGIGPKVETKLTATLGGKEIKTPVKNGEVISYKVEVSNVGTEEITNAKVIGKIPEGTTRVVPQPNYEYTGSSYYKELEDKQYEETIETLKVGEVVTKTYEVRVNKGVAEGTKLNNQMQVKYGDVTKETNAIETTTAKGDLRISVKRVTDRRVDLYTAGTVEYFAIIENISDQKQENVKVHSNLSDNLEVKRLTLITGMKSEEVSDDDIYKPGESSQDIQGSGNQTADTSKSEIMEYQEEVNIGTLEAGEVKVLSYNMTIEKTQNDKIDFSVNVKNGKEDYDSNEWEDKIEQFDLALSMTSNTKTQYLKAGDEVEYTILAENKGTSETTGITIKDKIPTQMSVKEVTVNGEKLANVEGNNLELFMTIPEKSTATIKIQTVVNYSEGRKQAEAITNVATAEVYGEKIASTAEINHIIQANEGSQDPGENGDNDVDDNDIAKGTRTITGIAWYDENLNGQRDNEEKTMNDVKVKLLNAETNHFVKNTSGQVLEVTTNENGVYVLDHIGNGKYIVVFDYDQTKYTLAKYKATGTIEANNSKALMNELLIENEKQQVASTDMIEVQNMNVDSMNIGLVQFKNFDLALEKTVSKILIQNKAGTTVKEYNNETVAKAEIDAKQVNGTNIIIEYKITITNQGEVEGYVKKVADYIPHDLKFSSELNKDWYQSGDALYNASIANDKLAAGQSKTISLTLTKAMTENNTGLINNTAEIQEDYNELGIQDSNSTPGNKAQGENDMGSADVILSIRTGGIVYITIAIVIVAILGIVAIIILKHKKTKEAKQ